MTIALPKTRFTPDDLFELEDEGLFELVDGKLVQKEMSSLANETAGLILIRLGIFKMQTKSGFAVYPEQTFQCFPHDPSLVRIPDVSVIVADRRAEVPEEGHIPIAPDLAVEVISPNEKMYKFEGKLLDYRKAGVKLVWEVNPKFRFIRVHYLDRPALRLEETDMLNGTPVLPEFSILVKELLPPADGNVA